MRTIRFLCFSAALALAFFSCAAELATDLRARGYSLIPAPREAALTGRDVTVDRSWTMVAECGAEHIAARRLLSGAEELHGLRFDGAGPGKVILRIQPGTVEGTAAQGYRLEIKPEEAAITGNSSAGLFYGVQSLLQLLRPDGAGAWKLPAGVITDQPALELRFVHWDTKHHQARMETLKRYIDWAAFFKANAIGFEIEDKYEYPRHPVIGAPGAFTKAQMQELTAYALARFVQLVPQIQSPAHMAYVLKHEEFAHLRADGSNYQACMCDPEAIRLIEDMFQDMIDATPGVEYFHVSTDEVYYAGICDKCQARRPYNAENRSLAWVEYVNHMHDWLAKRGRKMLCWVEYPLLQEHLDKLPAGLINGIAGPRSGAAWIHGLNQSGVTSLVYSSQQGEELLIPGYFPLDPPAQRRPAEGRLWEPAAVIPATIATGANLSGAFAAAWGDSGLHSETFWLGWATVMQYAWTPDTPSVEQSVADFMDVFYGPGNQEMAGVYKMLNEGARFYEEAWDRTPATRLKPSYGSYAGKGRGTVRIDYTLTPPALPFGYDETIVTEDRFGRMYAKVIDQAPAMKRRIADTIQILQGALASSRNKYNLEVLLSIAQFESYFCNFVLDLKRVEDTLLEASRLQNQERFADVHSRFNQAHEIVAKTLAERAAMWADLEHVWETSWLPKGQSVDGREFVHLLDDVKDHRADRRPGLDYMLEPFDNIGLEEWNKQLKDFTIRYAENYGLAPGDK